MEILEIKLNDVIIDSEWTQIQIEETLKKGGERANIAVDKMIITDCGDDGIKSGFKIVFNDSYPKGSIIYVKEYKYDTILHKVNFIGEPWRRT